MSDKLVNGWRQYLNKVQTSNQRKGMKDLLWERRENWKVDRMIFNRVLLEGRLENVKKKYGERLPGDYIDMLSSMDPSGNNKYLAHMVKLFLKYVEDVGIKDTRSYRPAIRTIGTRVEQFHDLNKYIPAEKGGRDIHSYKTIDDLNQAVANAEAKKKAKDEAALFKEKVRGDAQKIYQDKTTLVIRPGSEESSCYYGQGTKWCIAATDSRNYWDDYTNEQGAVFFFIIDKVAPEEIENDRGKVAYVYNADHPEAQYPWDAYDAVDDQLDPDSIDSYESIWGTEKFNQIIGGIQDSLDEDPPDPGVDLDVAADELREYAEQELGDWSEFIEFYLYVDDDEGISASAKLSFEFPIGYDPDDEQEAEQYTDDSNQIEDAYQEGINMDYVDFDYDYDFTNQSAGEVTLRISTTLTCDDCMGGYNIGNEQRQEYRDNTQAFIDNIVGEYTEDYTEYKEELRKALVKKKVIAPDRWDRTQEDIINQMKALDLQHFKLNLNAQGGVVALQYEMVENAALGPAASAPTIGSYGRGQRDTILFSIMRANFDEVRGWYSSVFDLKASQAIKQYFAEAHEAAKQQLELPLKGGTYKKPEETGSKEWEDPSMMVYLKEGVAGSNEFKGSVQILFTKWHTGEDAQATMAFIKSLDRHYDDIVNKLTNVYDEMTGEYTEKMKQADQGVLDGSTAADLIRSIDDKILSEPENVRESVVGVLKWFQENFGKMSGIEKTAAVDYLKRVETERFPLVNVYLTFSSDLPKSGVPQFWKKFVRDELKARGASHSQVQGYKWQGKRDELVESVRIRVREVINEWKT